MIHFASDFDLFERERQRRREREPAAPTGSLPYISIQARARLLPMVCGSRREEVELSWVLNPGTLT